MSSAPTLQAVKESLADVCKTLDGKEWVLGNSSLSGKGYTDLGQALSTFRHVRYLDGSSNELGSLETTPDEGEGDEEAGKEDGGEDSNNEAARHPLQALTGLTSLLALNLSSNSILTFPKELQLPNLQIANVSKNRMTDLPFNAQATPALTTLDISENALGVVEGLDGMSSLISLKINANTAISSLEGLGSLASLQSLDASNCDLQDIKGLEGLSTSFATLNVSNNNIASLEGMNDSETLNGLAAINFSNNSIENLEELVHLSKLPGLKTIELDGNPCADVDEFRTECILRIPGLASIDGLDVTPEERKSAAALGVQRQEEAAAAEAAAAAAAAAAEEEGEDE